MKRLQYAAMFIGGLLTVVIGGCDNNISSPVGPNLTTGDGAGASAAIKGGKVAICHLTGNGEYGKITVSVSALPAHLGHGDALPGSDGLDESCQEQQVPDNPCPCFDAGALAELDLTFGGSAGRVDGTNTYLRTNALGMGLYATRSVEAGQHYYGAPYSCMLRDDTSQTLVQQSGITSTEAASCRLLITDEWPELF